MVWEEKRVLITVKAYPNPSEKYQETVCVAGIDIDNFNWIRLYPIPFRDLDEKIKFRKYNIIKARVTRPKRDKRPESYKVDTDSIEIVQYLDTKNKWAKRKDIILGAVDKSMCQIIRDQENFKKSLGIFKPFNVDFSWEKAKPVDMEKRKSYYQQLNFFKKQKDAIEYIPFIFRYTFKCKNELDCPGHSWPIVDWEIGQAFRKWKTQYFYNTEVVLEKIKQKLLEIFSDSKNVYFYVGNMWQFPKNFLILGVFYPPV